MFIEFFYHLRERGLPISTTEFLALLRVLEVGAQRTSLDRFYSIARSVLVKRVEHYDIYDQAFLEFFEDHPFTLLDPDELTEELLEWLQDPKALRELTEEERAALEAMDLDELRSMYEERLREQDERHDGGDRWIGTGGTSPFGNNGEHPSGIRVGGESRSKSAVAVAQARRFRNLRSDLKLDVRQIGMALRKLKVLTREGIQDELDLEGTIDLTAKNAGDLEIVFRAPRKNRVKLLLLMDVGGSMTPYSRLCSRMFSAAHQATHFQAFKAYYFHNCPYGRLYEDMSQRTSFKTGEVLKEVDQKWKCIIVGDAAMAPSELMSAGGSIDLYSWNERSGLAWLREIKERVPSSVWLNPDPIRYWDMTYTVQKIREIFPMHALTLDGLEEAIGDLRRGGIARPR